MSKWERGMWFTFTNSHMNLIKQHNTASTIWKRKNERRVIHNVYTRQRDREPSICSNCAQLFKLFHKFSKSLIDVSCGVVWCSAARHRNYLIVCVDQKIHRWFFPISNIEKKKWRPEQGLNERVLYDGYHSEIFHVRYRKSCREPYNLQLLFSQQCSQFVSDIKSKMPAKQVKYTSKTKW